MTTATGEYSLNFTGIADGTFSNGNFTLLTSPTGRVASNVFRATTVGAGRVLYAYTGSSYGTGAITSKIEATDCNALGDAVILAALDTDGDGYGIEIGSDVVSIRRYAAYALTETLGAGTGHTFAAGSVYAFAFTKGPAHSWTLTQNGTPVTLQVTSDSTATLGTMRAVFGVNPDNTGAATIGSVAVDGLAVTKSLRVTAHPSAAGVGGVSGVVFAEPSGGDLTGARLGEFSNASFAATLEGGLAVLTVLTSEFDSGDTLTTADTPVALVRSPVLATTLVSCTVVEV